jgi:dCMP deaminase
MNKWDKRFLEMAALVATWSKDTTKVGCVIVGSDREVLGVGYNGLPRGVMELSGRTERPAKYLWTEHAERNALYNALLTGVKVSGATMYLNWYPCADCARGIIQSGITCVVAGQEPNFNDPTWGVQFEVVADMLKEAGVRVYHP